jgi:hypothetical protein
MLRCDQHPVILPGTPPEAMKIQLLSAVLFLSIYRCYFTRRISGMCSSCNISEPTHCSVVEEVKRISFLSQYHITWVVFLTIEWINNPK